MNVLIIGAGRMGIRHMQGVLSISKVQKVTMLDVNQVALDAAVVASHSDLRLHVSLLNDFDCLEYDICIIASTAHDRRSLIKMAVDSKCRYLLIEKPLGQSYEEVANLVDYLDTLPISSFVNLNMRLYPSFIKLREDLSLIPQMLGPKTIMINTGSLGIGCNGIHLLDEMFFLLRADRAELMSAEIEDTLIPSGRGKDFCDFGGWSVIKYYKDDEYVGKSLLSMASTSTAFGGWEIITPNARIVIDEIMASRVTHLRKADSSMPINRYGADYLPPEYEKFESPFLGDLTAKWILGLIDNRSILPSVKESLNAHKLLFQWLAFSKLYKNIFPIT